MRQHESAVRSGELLAEQVELTLDLHDRTPDRVEIIALRARAVGASFWDRRPGHQAAVVNAEGPVFILNTMQPMPDDLTRVYSDERLKRAAHRRLIRAVQLRNRAERATERARKALAAAVIDQ